MASGNPGHKVLERVKVFDYSTTRISKKSKSFTCAMCVSASDLIYVADACNRVQVFTQTGKYRQSFGVFGVLPGQFNCVQSMCASRTDQFVILAVKLQNLSIQIYDSEGNYSSRFGDEYFINKCYGIAVDKQDNIAVLDSMGNFAIFDLRGTKGVERKCEGDRNFSGIAVSDDKKIFISARYARCVQVYNYVGEYLYDIGRSPFSRDQLIGVCVKTQGDVLAAAISKDGYFVAYLFSKDGSFKSKHTTKFKHDANVWLGLLSNGCIVIASTNNFAFIYRAAEPSDQLRALPEVEGGVVAATGQSSRETDWTKPFNCVNASSGASVHSGYVPPSNGQVPSRLKNGHPDNPFAHLQQQSFQQPLPNTPQAPFMEQYIQSNNPPSIFPQQHIQPDSITAHVPQQHVQHNSFMAHVPQQHIQPDSITEHVPQQYVQPNNFMAHVPQQHIQPDSITEHVPQQHVQPNNFMAHVPQQHIQPNSITAHVPQQHVQPNSFMAHVPQQHIQRNRFMAHVPQQHVQPPNAQSHYQMPPHLLLTKKSNNNNGGDGGNSSSSNNNPMITGGHASGTGGQYTVEYRDQRFNNNEILTPSKFQGRGENPTNRRAVLEEQPQQYRQRQREKQEPQQKEQHSREDAMGQQQREEQERQLTEQQRREEEDIA